MVYAPRQEIGKTHHGPNLFYNYLPIYVLASGRFEAWKPFMVKAVLILIDYQPWAQEFGDRRSSFSGYRVQPVGPEVMVTQLRDIVGI